MNYSATSNNMKLVHWLLMGGLLHLVQWGNLGVPNVTAQPSTASVPITVLFYLTVRCSAVLMCGDCRKKWRLTDTDLCPCGETQTMSHIVKSCPLTMLNGGLSGCTLQMKTLFPGWTIMVHDTHTRKRRSVLPLFSCCLWCCRVLHLIAVGSEHSMTSRITWP